LDRFFLSLNLTYPDPAEERRIVEQTTRREKPEASCVLDIDAVTALQNEIFEVPVPDHVLDYILRLVQASRPSGVNPPDVTTRYIAWGAGPRAAQTFTLAAKGLALLRGRPTASVEEVRELALPVLRHRIIPNYTATGEGVSVDTIIAKLLDTIPVKP
jgi:MoxR-like ATPase